MESINKTFDRLRLKFNITLESDPNISEFFEKQIRPKVELKEIRNLSPFFEIYEKTLTYVFLFTYKDSSETRLDLVYNKDRGIVRIMYMNDFVVIHPNIDHKSLNSLYYNAWKSYKSFLIELPVIKIDERKDVTEMVMEIINAKTGKKIYRTFGEDRSNSQLIKTDKGRVLIANCSTCCQVKMEDGMTFEFKNGYIRGLEEL